MIPAEAGTEAVSPQVIGLWVLAAGVVMNALLGAAKLWKTLHGDPERRAVNVLADNATKDEVKSLAADVSELRREMKIDRDAITKSAEERARYLNAQINDVLAAVNKVSGVVDRMRDELRPGRP
jgi:hypothetical protein